MSEVHADYMLMFKEVAQDLFPTPTSEISHPTPDIEAVKNAFAFKRQEILAMRGALRRDTQRLMQGVGSLPLEAAFLYSIYNYFMRHESYGADLTHMASVARMLGEQEPDKYVNTPSGRLFKLIADDTDPVRMHKIVVSERSELAHYFSDVVTRYRDLRRHIQNIESSLARANESAG